MSCFLILLKVLRLNPRSLHHQLTFLALFSTCNLRTLSVLSVLIVLLLSDLPLLIFSLFPSLSYFFTFFYIVLFVGRSFSGNLHFYFQIATGFVIRFNNKKTLVSNLTGSLTLKLCFFISFFKVGIKFSKKYPIFNRPYRITPSKIIAMHFGIVLVITKTDSHYELKTTN